MSFPLLKYFIKRNWLIWLAVLGFIYLEFCVCIFLLNLIGEIISVLPDSLMGDGFAMETEIDGPYALIYAANLLPMYGCVFPMMFYLFAINKLVIKPVDSQSLSGILTAGVDRRTYLTTAAMFLAGGLVLMFLGVFAVVGACICYWGAFNWWWWLGLCVGFLFVNMAIAGICFLVAAIFSGRPFAAGLNVGLPVLFFIFYMLSDYSRVFKFFTPLGHLNAAGIASGDFGFAWLWMLIYFAAAVAATIGSIFVFKKRQLSI
jgi:hypothetical protein